MTSRPNSSRKKPAVLPSERKSAKFIEARDSLPDNLRETYDRLVDEYHFATIQQYGAGYVAYPVLAELVRTGWRSTGESREGSEC